MQKAKFSYKIFPLRVYVKVLEMCNLLLIKTQVLNMQTFFVSREMPDGNWLTFDRFIHRSDHPYILCSQSHFYMKSIFNCCCVLSISLNTDEDFNIFRYNLFCLAKPLK